jgi:integrase
LIPLAPTVLRKKGRAASSAAHLNRGAKFLNDHVDEAREMAGLVADVTPHVLRHTCATLMFEAGISTWDVAGVLGTSEAVTRKTYGHHSVEHLRRAVDVWSNRIVNARGGGVSGRRRTRDALSC